MTEKTFMKIRAELFNEEAESITILSDLSIKGLITVSDYCRERDIIMDAYRTALVALIAAREATDKLESYRREV